MPYNANAHNWSGIIQKEVVAIAITRDTIVIEQEPLQEVVQKVVLLEDIRGFIFPDFDWGISKRTNSKAINQ